MKTWPPKDPDERLDYTYDWSPDLKPGETIASAVLTPTELAGLTVVNEQVGASAYTVWFSGGNDGEEGLFTLRITTSENRIFEDDIALPIVAKVPTEIHPGDYTDPTASNLLALFPEFASVPAATIGFYLNRAAQSVDATWAEGDFAYARMSLAAHLLTVAGLGKSAEASSVNDGSSQFKTMAIGSLRLERFDPAKGNSFASTRYGREYARLLRLNRGGPRVAGPAPALDMSDGDKAWY